MSEEFTRITISGAFPLTPNRNYVCFTPEAVKQALAEMDKLPIVDLTDEAEPIIGWVDGNAYDVEESATEIGYKLNATIFRARKDYREITNVEFQSAAQEELYGMMKIINAGVE